MSLYTRKGDSGNTSLPDGKRVSKDDARVEAYGDVDELTAQISFLNALCSAEGSIPASRRVSYYKPLLERIIRELFAVGGVIACPGSDATFAEEIKALETEIDAIERSLPPLKCFILPTGCRASCQCQVCRTVCRRVERRVVTFLREENIDSNANGALKYLNRLSDLLFALSRRLNADAGITDTKL
ncbi:MAG: cob(I)yrinic acid a,c-diamide adenosyltransferase [Bacteroidales bacterium]|nr:cob(I)yrinic acid a,c-diamide adenosyltransferase [Bacteroidales bacterium]